MAYRTADYERWQQLDFIVGIRIQLSNNHTCLGKDGKPHPFYDICDELKGTYPKDFKFTGWHPHCRCIATTILKTDEEMAADDEAIMRGEQPSDPDESDNAVKELPDNFKQWMEDNEERIERAKSLPYFLRDNEKLISGTTMLSEEEKTLTPQKVKEKQNNDFSDEIKANNKELSEVLPVEQGKIMSFSEANAGKPNPDYKKKDGSVDNCQTCTMAYELRRRGFDVEALPNPVAKGYKKMREFDQLCSQQGVEWLDRWQTTEGKRAEYQWARGKTKVKERLEFIESQISSTGRYEIYCTWKRGSAHVFNIEKTKKGDIIWYDPQSGKKGKDVEAYVNKMNGKWVGVLRIDDKIVNPKFASRLIKARK